MNYLHLLDYLTMLSQLQRLHKVELQGWLLV
jgi:hypothetical protein